MEYSRVADEMLRKMTVLIRSHSHKKLGEFVEGEMFVLNHLTFVREKVLPNELASVMNASTSRIAAILNSLEKKGWITRQIDETDRRRIVVTLTDSGRRFVSERQKAIRDGMEDVLKRLGEEDTREALRLLDRFIDIYNELTPERKTCESCESAGCGSLMETLGKKKEKSQTEEKP